LKEIAIVSLRSSVKTIVPTMPIDCARLSTSENPIKTINVHKKDNRINCTGNDREIVSKNMAKNTRPSYWQSPSSPTLVPGSTSDSAS
jgi:hypothetical protein